jgi:hypothetical protein
MYHILRPFKAPKLVSYLNGKEYRVHATEEYVFFGEEGSLFRVPQIFTKQYHKELGPYLPAKLHQEYKGQKGELEEYAFDRVRKEWDKHIAMTDAYIVCPTNHLYQVEERILLRKFTDGENTVWLNKVATDIFGPMEWDLAEAFQFEMLYHPSNPDWAVPVRISFRMNAKDDWQPIALLSPFKNMEEK